MGPQERVRNIPILGGPGPESSHNAHAGLRASAQRFGSEGDRIVDRVLSADTEAFGRQSRQQSGE